MVSVYKRGTKLYLQFYVNGKRRQRTTGLDDTPANRKLLKQKVIPKLEAKIVSGELDEIEKENEPFEFGWYARKYSISKEHLKSWPELNTIVKFFEESFKGRRIDTIKSSEIEDLLLEKAWQTSPRTARWYLGTLRAIFKVAMRHEHIDRNPCDIVELPKHTPKEIEPFNEEEAARIVETAEGWLKNYLSTAFYTGMRPGEIFGLMKSDIDLDARTIQVRRAIKHGMVMTPKTKNSVRTVVILDALVPYLEKQIEASKSSLYLFPGKDGGPMHGASIVKRRWKELLKSCGIEYRKPYATRHTFITTMLKSGKVTLMELAQMVGHKNTEMIVRNYARFIKGEHLKIDRSFDPFQPAIQPTPVEKTP